MTEVQSSKLARQAAALPVAPVATLPPAAHALWNEVDALLVAVDCDAVTRAAAAWYAVARIDAAAWQAVSAQAPEALRRLVAGQQQAERVWALHATRDAGSNSEGLRRLLLAIIRDLRVVYLLLARQLARMRAAAGLPEAERRGLAQLTRDIHAPLANRLGIGQWKWELEDLAFRYLQPDVYHRIAKLLDERRADREAWIARSVDELRAALAAQGIHAEVNGRAKHIYSIWRKMQRKRVGFGELYDIRALRVLTATVADCYAVLGAVHGLWPIIPQEFDDYIARPKGNNYRSLHTAVVGPDGKTLEVQIRTGEMHRAAELGVAAHWRYKEGGQGDAAYQARVAWMRKLLEARGDEDDQNLAAELRGELAEERVYLLTPKGAVIDLPAGATVLDFAYHVHTLVGHRCRGAKVNDRIVPLTYQPVSGDRIEILTAREPAPSRDWLSPQLGYLNTASARGKLRAWFRREDLAANLAAGRQLLEREVRRLAVPDDVLERLPLRLGRKSRDDLLVGLALGEVGSVQLTRALLEAQPAAPDAVPAPPAVRKAATRGADKPGALTVEGIGNLLTTLARCCRPLPGDTVTGYITRGHGVTVHRADCAALARLRARNPERVVDVRWQSAPDRAYEVAILVTGFDRRDLQRDVTGVVTNSGARIVSSDSRSESDIGEVAMHFTLRLHDFGELSALLTRLAALPNVVEARRLAGG